MTRRLSTVAALGLVAGLLVWFGQAPGEGAATKVHRRLATIVRVSDGDTIVVRFAIDGPEHRVRMVGIDTPEVYGTVECGGPKASRSLKRMLPEGTQVRLVSDPTQSNQDVYGRLLRYVVKVSTGRDMNRAQVMRGWARVYVYDVPFDRVKSYRTAQRKAKAADRGIWGAC